MKMAKLFSEKLNNLEINFAAFEKRMNQIDEINEVYSANRIDNIEKRLSECEAKINQLINEITPILISHANALKELMNVLNKK